MSRRSSIIKFRAFPEESASIKEAAAAAGLTASDYVRRRCIGTDTQLVRRRTTMPEDVASLVRELAAIGNNVNQLARKANSGDGINGSTLDATLTEIIRLIQKISA